MSLDSVRAWFAQHAPDIAIEISEQSSATVPLAAEAHGVPPHQIAKTLSLRIGDQVLTAVITRDAVNELKLRRGDEAVAIIKSTEVMIGRTEAAPRGKAR